VAKPESGPFGTVPTLRSVLQQGAYRPKSLPSSSGRRFPNLLLDILCSNVREPVCDPNMRMVEPSLSASLTDIRRNPPCRHVETKDAPSIRRMSRLSCRIKPAFAIRQGIDRDPVDGHRLLLQEPGWRWIADMIHENPALADLNLCWSE
jgi:hypothetical protein